ncbi:MAG: hypothetical protein KBS39_05030, partial [Lachnospiraceae bacterium]|nr:hypothetical protein [Candidatus Hippenecus merdae]
EKSGRNFLWIDTGALADGFMPRLDISGTDAEMYEGTFFGMVPLNGKLYLLSELDIADPKESGSTVWSRDMGKTSAWKRVNDVPVNRYTLGNADMSVEKCSTVMAYQGMIVFALDCLEPVTETCVTYIVTVDPETGKVTTSPAARENYPAEAMYLGVVSLGEKLAYIRTWEDAGSEVVSEISLFAVTENGTLSRKATHVESDKAIFADAIYQEDGTFLAGGISEEGEAVQQGLFRFTVTEEICSCELVTEKQYHMTDDVKDPDSQEASYLTTPLKNALISTGIRDNIGSDTYIFAELSAEGTVTPDPLCVDTAKLQNFAAAAADGKYYVLAQTRNGSEEGRCILCCQDLAELGLSTIKNPGDTEKPVPPGPTPTPGPVYGGGGGTVTTNGLAYSKFWV